jgi:V/A-type H+-transporting ATPase subunit E
MSEKLRLLTEKIYEEGIEKAKQESEKILAHAHAEAERLIKEAQKEKDNLLQTAAAEADAHRRKVEAEIKLAAVKAGNQLRADIENLLSEEHLTAPLTKGLADAQILRDVLVACVSALKQNGGDWSILLSPEAEKQVQSWISDTRQQALQQGVEILADTSISEGFKVVSKGDGYALSFSAGAFTSFLSRYLKPETLRLVSEQA